MNRPLPNLLALALLAGLVSCTRNNDNAYANCISRSVLSASTPLIRQSAIDSANTLFVKNGLSPANLQPWLVDVENNVGVLSTTGVGYSGTIIQVISNQFLNGLPVFFTSASYIFDTAGKIIPYGTNGYEGPLPGTDTSGHQTLATLRSDFLSTYYYSNPRGGPVGHLLNIYHDSCFTAILGYADASFVPASGIKTQNQALIKVWEIRTSTRFPLPRRFL